MKCCAQVREKYPLTSEERQHRRRDLRRGEINIPFPQHQSLDLGWNTVAQKITPFTSYSLRIRFTDSEKADNFCLHRWGAREGELAHRRSLQDRPGLAGAAWRHRL